MRQLISILTLVIVVALVGCRGGDSENIVNPTVSNPGQVVADNMQLVRAAADAFAAADPNLQYPLDLSATTTGGQTLINLLPNGQMLLNPYTGEYTEPRDGLVSSAGRVGYEPVEIGGARSSFLINGWGETEEIARFDNIIELEAATIATAEAVVAAAEAFADDNNGIYPSDVRVDESLAGKTLTHYLPEGVLMLNAFTLANTEPVDASATNMGEIGYSPNSYGGITLGYTVAAVGREDQQIFQHMVEASQDDIVLANVELVREAANAFAAADDLQYPLDLSATTPGGQTLIDLLPDGEMLLNPYTGERTEPRDGPAASAGQVGYEPAEYGGVRSMFQINGWGESTEIALVDNIEELESAVIANAELVVEAAEAWAADNNGLYPHDIGVHQNALGKTLIDYLPDGRLMMNPFHLANTEPVDGASAVVGEVGYAPVVVGGYTLGYVVTASGRQYQVIFSHVVSEDDPLEAQVKVNCYKTRDAAEQFAADNNGVYPSNIGADTTLLGDTLVDLLGGVLLENPYTQANTVPMDAAAATPGETGYIPIVSQSVTVGCMITGYGANGLIVELVVD